jgi:TolB-like protein/Tfp pilus assembly protein PilF
VIYRFADSELDTERYELHCEGVLRPVEPQVFDLLRYLLENRDRTVTKDELYKAIWQGRFVSESTLSSRIKVVRQAVNDTGSHQRIIRTVHGRGFRFVAQVEAGDGDRGERHQPLSETNASIAVLPFVNMSGDPEQEYFSDGVTEDIITELSRFHSLLVIARNSSFQYRGQTVDVRRVGRELGVQYVVEGSVRRAHEHVRITAQLVEAVTCGHLWAHHYDRGLRDIFAIQDEVTTAIVAAIAGQVQATGIDRVRRKRTDSLAAYDFFLRGLEHYNRAGSEDTLPARDMFARAIDIDPNFAQAHALLAEMVVEVHHAEVWSSPPEDCAATLQQALTLAQRAVALDGNDAVCHRALAYVHTERKSFDAAGHHFDIAARLNPNDANVLASRSMLELHTGRSQQALQSLDLAIRLNPTPPNWYWELQGLALYNLSRYAEAAKAFERATARQPYVYRFLAACYAQMKRLSEARALASESLRLQPGFTLRAWATVEPFESHVDRDHMLDGMRKAGLPE